MASNQIFVKVQDADGIYHEWPELSVQFLAECLTDSNRPSALKEQDKARVLSQLQAEYSDTSFTVVNWRLVHD